MPTLSFAGSDPLPAGVTIDGCNLLPAMTKRGRVERADPPLFWNSGYYKVVRAGNWKLQINETQGKAWLFNLGADPTEKINLIDTNPFKRAELQALLARQALLSDQHVLSVEHFVMVVNFRTAARRSAKMEKKLQGMLAAIMEAP